MLIGVFLNYIVPEEVFIIVTSIATFAAVWIWGTIIIVQMKSRVSKSPEEVSKIAYKMPWYPYSNYFSLAGLVFVCVILTIGECTRIAMIVGPLWIIGINVVYNLLGWNKKDAQ